MKGWIIQRVMLQHRNEHTYPTVGESAQCTSMRMPFGSELGIVGPAVWIADGTHASAVVERIAQACVCQTRLKYKSRAPNMAPAIAFVT